MNEETLKLTLMIEQRSKGIPYPSEVREDSTNHGFKDLKSDSSLVDTVSEIEDCPVLRNALVVTNAPDTPFFTVGCEQSLNPHQGKFWKRGYLEFSYNYVELLSDATHYFRLFFHFNQLQHVREFLSKHPIHLGWELQGCRFRKRDVVGFTCCVWITVGDHATAAECEAVWNEAVDHVAGFLAAVKITPPASSPLYGPPKAG